jgi:hypothetical protein
MICVSARPRRRARSDRGRRVTQAGTGLWRRQGPWLASRILNTLDAFIDGTRADKWRGEDGDIVRHIRERGVRLVIPDHALGPPVLRAHADAPHPLALLRALGERPLLDHFICRPKLSSRDASVSPKRENRYFTRKRWQDGFVIKTLTARRPNPHSRMVFPCDSGRCWQTRAQHQRRSGHCHPGALFACACARSWSAAPYSMLRN